MQLLPGTPAHALTLFNFRGVVRDVLNRPLAGVRIYTDPSSTVTTDVNGAYTLPESTTGNFRINAVRTGLVSEFRDKRVDIPDPTGVQVDFNGVLYDISTPYGQQSSFTTASGPAVASVAITSWAPQPSCVTVTDSRPGGGGPATFVSTNANGSSTWRYALSLPAGTAQGSYALSISASDCAGTRVSKYSTWSYLVDNTPPAIQAALPDDHGQTAFILQPVGAKVVDSGGSGVTAGNVQFALRNLSTLATTTASAATYNPTTTKAYTNPQTLTLGARYELTVTATDAVGNAAAPLVTHFTVAGPDVSTVAPRASATATGSISSALGTGATAAFVNAPLLLDDFRMTWDGLPEHFGFGYIGVNVDLTRAVVKEYRKGAAADGSGDVLLATNPAPSSWGVRGVLAQYQIRRNDAASQSVRVQGFSNASPLTLPTLTAPVTNPLADKVVLSLDAAGTGYLPSCTQPESCAAWKFPTPDPLPYFVSDADHAQLEALRQQGLTTAQQTEQETADANPDTCDPLDIIDADSCVYTAARIADLMPD